MKTKRRLARENRALRAEVERLRSLRDGIFAMIDARSDAEFAESVAPESTAADRACSFVAAMALEAMTAELAAILSKRERVARDERRIERVEAMTHIAKVPS